MIKIVANDELVAELEAADGIVELVDKHGKRIGTISRPPSAEDIRIAKERIAGDGPWTSAADAIRHLESLNQQ